MILSKKILLFITCCFVAAISVAQQNKNEAPLIVTVPFIGPGTMDCLMCYTHTMFKDAKGFLWVGGGGFSRDSCRFDGAVFKRYFPGQRKRGAINSDDIYTFKEDSLHNIWMGTGKGISRYDMKADTFTNFSPFIDSAFPN